MPDEVHVDGVEPDDEGQWTFNWRIYAMRLEDAADERWALVGDLFICTVDWHLSVAALCPLIIRARTLARLEELPLEEVAARLGVHAQHALWDFVSQHARVLATGVRSEFPLPYRTPQATFGPPTSSDDESVGVGEAPETAD